MAQFYVYVSNINQRFQKLSHILQCTNLKYAKGQSACSIEEAKLLQKLTKDSTLCKNDSRVTQNVQALNFREFFQIYDKQLSLCWFVNDAYSVPSVFYMLTCFIVNLFAIFLVVKVHVLVGGMNRLLDFTIFWYCTWSVICMLMAFSVLHVCNKANDYITQLPTVACDIIRRQPPCVLTNDNENYTIIKSGSLQFLHWRRYFRFNALGLFNIDNTFIYLMISAATSYLVVLLQLNMQSIFINEGLL